MDLLEYQAKELFREIGIPVLPAQRIDQPGDIKYLEIPYPVVLKSQVPAGGRAKAGGIRLVENTIDAIAAARAIFNLPILGQYPQVLLAESHYDAEQEFYLAVILDYQLGHPVLLGACQGGINLEVVITHLQKVVVEQEFSPFYARRLALKMGLQGQMIESVSNIVQKMYQLFVQKDLELVEINPLGISSTGELMALDGKISVNDAALGRHTELINLASIITNPAPINIPKQNYNPRINNIYSSPEPEIRHQPQPHSSPNQSQPTELKWTDPEGNIGIICNSRCLATATLDLVYQAKGKPASCLIVDCDPSWDLSSLSTPQKQLSNALHKISTTQGIEVVLVNIVTSTAASKTLAELIANSLLAQVGKIPILSLRDRQERPTGTLARNRREPSNRDQSVDQQSVSTSQLPNFVIKIVGGEIDAAKNSLVELPVHWSDNIDRAVAQTISLAKSALKQS